MPSGGIKRSCIDEMMWLRLVLGGFRRTPFERDERDQGS